jgi:hypothetical protein
LKSDHQQLVETLSTLEEVSEREQYVKNQKAKVWERRLMVRFLGPEHAFYEFPPIS